MHHEFITRIFHNWCQIQYSINILVLALSSKSMDVSCNKNMLRAYDMSRQNTTAPVQRGGQQIRRKHQNRAKEASDNAQIQRDKVLENGEKLGVRVRVR